MTEKDETHLLSGAYALDALTSAEARALESAMADSEELRGEVVGLVDTAVALGLAVPPAAPPAALRASLLAAIDATPQLPADEEPARAASVTPIGERSLRGSDHVARRRRGLLRRPAVLLTAAAVAVLLFGGGVLVRGAMVEPQLEYSRIIAAADHHESTAAVIGGGTATVQWSRSEGAAAVTVSGVEVPSGRVLQLWTVRDGVATSAGLYDPESDAQYELLHRVPQVGQQLAVSVEPAGGSAQPSKVVASVALRA